MGICINEAKLILGIKKYNHELGKVATLGRQYLFLKDNEIRTTLSSAGISSDVTESFLKTDHKYCERYLELLGATQVHSFDASNYENATIIHDMNFPIGEDSKSQYDTFIESGTFEHIFNFPVAVKNCMQLVRPKGYYVSVNPANNFFGHGFYQFSPEIYFRIFSEENGFQIKKVILYWDNGKGDFYELKDPKSIANRITLVNTKPLFLSVIAQRISDVEPFSKKFPNQSDYSDLVWKNESLVNHQAFPMKGVLSSIKKMIPKSIKEGILKMRSSAKIILSQTGNLDSFHYKKIDKD